MAKGAWDMGSTIAGYSDRLSDAEIASTATTSTDMRNGVAYERTDAADAGGVIGYTNAQNKASKASMISSGAEIGGGVGALVGTAIPGIGTVAGGLIGTGLGALTNWALDGIFGLGSKRKRAIQDALNRQAMFARNTTL